MAVRIRRAIFDSPISDEVTLSRKARKYIEHMQHPLSKEDVLAIARDDSVELATRCFYEALLKSKHRKVISQICHESTDPIAVDGRIKLIIVPGMFYQGHPEVGTDGSLVSEIASRFGFDVDTVNSESTGSIATNTKYLKNALKNETHQNVWLVSISKGACEVRKFLQENPKPDFLKGWVNIAGIHKGVPFVDAKFRTFAHRFFFFMLCRIFGVDYEALKELRTNRDFWDNQQWPNDMETINIVPVPLRSHVNMAIMHRYDETLAYGPNDGFIPLVDSLDLPGHIFPVWGYDHFMRTPDLSAYLYRVLNYIVNRREE